MDVLFLSPADWGGPKGRFQHIAERIARNNRVLYVDGLGVRPLAPRDFRRVLRKLTRDRSATTVLATDNITRVTPLVIPAQRPSGARAFNRFLLRRFLATQTGRLGFMHPLLWISYPHPDLVAILDDLGPHGIVYDCVDDWPSFTGVYHNIERAERRLLERADVVFTTALPLQEKASAINPNTFLVPNGVDLAAFDHDVAVPHDLASIPVPRIGFVGNIADWVDLRLIEHVARARSDWHFVLIGHYQASASRPRARNIHWLGFRPYADVPAYLSGFDVCIIPFVDNELTRSVDPLKLYEYLAAGKPVVSSPMPRMDDFAGVVRVASDAEGFASAIAECLDGATSREACIAAAGEHSWDARFDEIVRLVRRHTNFELAPEAN